MAQLPLIAITLLLAVSGSLAFSPRGRTAFTSGRIINGTDAAPGDVPYIVSLRSVGFSGHFCGGSLISDEWVVTAAHCLYYDQPSQVEIVVGVTDFVNEVRANFHAVSEIIVHALYDDWELSNDIALARLSTPVVFSDTISAVPLPEQGAALPAGEIARLSGWGRTHEDIYPDLLQWANLQVFSMAECHQRHGAGNIDDSMLCAGVPEGGKGQCSGDSGGPLVHDGTLIGLVSWSVKPCAIYPYPGVYCQVAQFRDWIRENSGV